MATVEIIELIKPETGEKFYPYAHLNGVKGAELLPRIGGSVQTTLPTPIFQIKDALNAQFYPQTHADAVIGLAQAIESNQFFAKESDGNGGFRIKLKDEFTGFYANGWIAAGGVGSGSGGGGLITSVKGVADLGTAIATESLTETFSAYAIQSIYNSVQLKSAVALSNVLPYASGRVRVATLTIDGTNHDIYAPEPTGGGGVETETDPIFSASAAFGISTTDIANWNAKVSNIQADWNATTGLAAILNKPSLSAVATSGSYNDLSNKPSIPDEATVSGWGFTKNTGTVTRVAMTVPTGLSVSGSPITASGTLDISFANGYSIPTTAKQSGWDAKYDKPSGGIPKTDLASAVQTSLGKADTALQSETDPTVPDWAKTPTKPSYAFSEITNKPTTLAGYGITDGFKKTGGDINGDIFHQIEEEDVESGEVTIYELWKITENGEATFESLSVNGVDFSTIDSRVNTLWNARNDYVTLSGAQTITGAKTFSGGITMSGANIFPSASHTCNIGASSAFFAGLYGDTIHAHAFELYSSGSVQAFRLQGGIENAGTANEVYYALLTLHQGTGEGLYITKDTMFGMGTAKDLGKTYARWKGIYGASADLSGDLVIGGNIVPAADLGSQLGYSSRRFSNLNVRTIGCVKEINFKDSDNSATTGYLSFANGWMILRAGADIDSSYKQINFHETYGLYPENGSSINLGYYSSTDNRYRWANIYGVNADLSGNLDVAGVVRVNSLNTIDQSNATMSLFNFGARATKTFNAYGTGVNFRACDSNGNQVNILAINATKIQAGSDLIPNYTEGLNLGGSSANTRWATIYGVNADLTGDLALAQTSHIDIGPLRIEYDATNKALHITKKDSTDTETYGLYADGFVAAGGVGQTS